ncbi:MAG TPA: YbaN family protein [Gemmatimonadaceae bacterium]|nr:YbaN family protein [Gemmatimonadaceae bacterium]
MSEDLIRASAPGNPACPAEPVKAALAGPTPDAQARGIRRYVLIGVGSVSLATGVIGMFVPLLPTTCFLLLAAWCFGKSSPRLHHWMYHNRWFGSYLLDYRSGRGIPRAVKIGSLAVLWGTIGATVVFAISTTWVRVLLLAIAVAVSAHVATQRDARAAAQ